MNSGTPLLKLASSRPSLYVCLRCQSKRHISQRFLAKKQRGREQWTEFAKEIKKGKRQSMLEILEERGFVNGVAGDRNALNDLMIKKRIGAYVGVDPTAPSLHVGHLLPLMALFWMHLLGFHTVSLIGGATAKVGDPSGRTTDRVQQTSTERKANLASMHYQLKRIWVNLEKIGAKHGYKWEENWHRELVNNAIWWNKLPMIEVLKLLGPGFRMGAMLSRDTVKTKLESKDGMSFSEFCYPIMQAWDFWQMYDEKGIQLQIGGADQYGNLVAGVQAVNYVAKTHPDPDIRQEGGAEELNRPFGLTVPLLTTSSGEKFGKSAGNAIWLDEQMTSSYDLFGFFMRTSDDDVERYLKLFTFLPISEIQSICDKHKNNPENRFAQHQLAREFVEFIHGPEAAQKAVAQHAALRTQSLSSILAANPSGVEPTTTAAETLPDPSEPKPQKPKPQKPNPLLDHPHPRKRLEGTYISPKLNPFAPKIGANSDPSMRVVLPKSLVYNQPIARVLYAAGLVSSRSEGHRLAQGRGAYIGAQSSNRAQMSDELDFVPAKLHDPAQTWKYVIKDEVIQGGNSGIMTTPGEEGVLILRSGKWKVRIVRVVSDELFETLNIDPPPPGYSEFKAQQISENAKEAWEGTERPRRRVDSAAEEEKDVKSEAEMSAWEIEDREMKRLAGDRELKPWDHFESSIKTGRKEAWAAMKEDQHKGMKYFRKQGVSEQDIREASYLGWNEKKMSPQAKKER